jgi:molybdenum cofactor cytidylyltransferase
MVTVLLAAGKASRMGAPKLLLPYRGKALILYALEAALASSDRVIIVTGFYQDMITEVLTPYTDSVQIIHNPQAEKGQFSSTLIGVCAVPKGELFAIAMGDAPLVTPNHYNQLRPLLRTHDAVRPCYRGTFGHPVLFAAHLREIILASSISSTMRGLLSQRNVFQYDSEDSAWITDIDTPLAYERLIREH